MRGTLLTILPERPWWWERLTILQEMVSMQMIRRKWRFKAVGVQRF